MPNDEELAADPYELLGLKLEATEQEIKTAYRQKSLKVHPDRNPNNPDAARKFHELNQCYEALLDPLRRLAVDAKLRLKKARDERYKAYDAKRKNLVDELEERERAFKKSRVEKQQEEVRQFHENTRIQDEGRRLREEREAARREREMELQRESSTANPANGSEAPALGANDTTVRVKYSLAKHPDLTSSEAITKLFSTFGESENVVVLLKSSKKKSGNPSKLASALIPFKKIGDAFAAVSASGMAAKGLEGIEVGWVGGKEPQILGWLKKMGMLGVPRADVADGPEENPKPSRETSAYSSFPDSFPERRTSPKPPSIETPGVDFEALTLMRLRQAERERLEREIREQEANE